ncbi:Ran-binding protein 3 [Galdieria sulphuraria]|uniref:Ran-binding protein n=1 Tax=Galdieria sulphuraria TaxID=130081 RepID=M2VZK4_GALSU|nr:Ran-binding protein [Galdieria sulphuraria]EME28771.1 Ran-binding protein [Galdieria sulphuraria]GJD07119.1 Ran-binding protein 3 [Galdieria sulphuraria]|eukprot:XP_005705291.1 Ran-binding protein [Galdieria sulphuraria]
MVKRAAEKQLTKDDQENEEEEEKQESNISSRTESSFTRASEEEIARRRVIKARRLRPAFSSENSAVSMTSVDEFHSSSQDSRPLASNPFASVSLVPTTSTLSQKGGDESIQEDSKGQSSGRDKSEVQQEEKLESTNGTHGNPTTTVQRDEGVDKVVEIRFNDTNEENNSAVEEKVSKEAQGKSHPFVPKSFGGFSGGEIHMDQLVKQSKGLQSSTDSKEFFWKDAKKMRPSGKSDSQVEESEDTVDDDGEKKSYEVPIETKEPILPEQKTVTGEEEEENLLRIRGKLYALEDKQWKEKGVGQLRFNVQQEDDSRGRFVMRAEGNLRVLLNFPIYSEFQIDRASERSVRFCAPGEDGKPKSLLFRAFSKEDATKLETTYVEWLKRIEQK